MKIRTDFVSNSSSSSFIVSHDKSIPYDKFIDEFLSFIGIRNKKDHWVIEAKNFYSRYVDSVLTEYKEFGSCGRYSKEAIIDAVNEVSRVIGEENGLIELKDVMPDYFIKMAKTQYNAINKRSKEDMIKELVETIKYNIDDQENILGVLKEIQKEIDNGQECYNIEVAYEGGFMEGISFYVDDFDVDDNGYNSGKYSFKVIRKMY